jgi:hypothetical protein
MASSAPSPAKWGRREDDNDESHCRRKLEKGKELVTKDADEDPFVDDTKFVVDLLRSAFSKLQDVGESFNIMVAHEVDKDPSMKGLTFTIHRLVEKHGNLPVVKWAGRHFYFDNGSFDSDDCSNGGYRGDDSRISIVATE